MKKIILGIVGLVAVCILLSILLGRDRFNLTDGSDVLPDIACTMEAKLCPDGSSVGRTGPQCAFAPCPDLQGKAETQNLISPLDRANERVTKKPFGISINPKTSPVQPERFSGYHTGTDFETFPDESDIAVSVHAACTGVLETKRRASGYGGLIVERCTLDGKSVSVIYGHMALGSVTAKAGDVLEQGSTIGILGEAKSADTDGERKHLHFGIFKGTGAASILGYVASQNELGSWIDSCLLVCKEKTK